jgi:hypothetical protein
MNKDDKNSNIKDAVEVTTELIKAVPIYQDLMQPAAKEIGTALGTVAKTVNIALAPIAGIVWSYETIQGYISTKVSEKLKNVPEEDIETPPISIAGPTLEALRFAGDEEELREMYANLLANALDKNTKETVHPSFVEIIKQLSAQEALVLKFLTNMKNFPFICGYDVSDLATLTVGDERRIDGYNPAASTSSNQVSEKFIEICNGFTQKLDLQSSLDNFLRLRLIEIETHSSQEFVDNSITHNDNTIKLKITYEEILQFSTFGESFIKTCVVNKT